MAHASEVLRDVAADFPGEFGMKGFPGERFRVSIAKSKVIGDSFVLVAVERYRGGAWEPWEKLTPKKLRQAASTPEASRKRGAPGRTRNKQGRFKDRRLEELRYPSEMSARYEGAMGTSHVPRHPGAGRRR